jgi:hypothetical protein
VRRCTKEENVGMGQKNKTEKKKRKERKQGERWCSTKFICLFQKGQLLFFFLELAPLIHLLDEWSEYLLQGTCTPHPVHEEDNTNKKKSRQNECA